MRPLMLLKSNVNTDDKRLKRGCLYRGMLVNTKKGLRIRLMEDSKGESMTFNPCVFNEVSTTHSFDETRLGE